MPTTLLSVLALDEPSVRHRVGFEQTEAELVRGLLLPDGSTLAARRAGEIWTAGELEEGDVDEAGSADEACGANHEDDDWADEGMRWDEAEL